MDMAPPDLSDPVQRAAYRRELLGIARPIRYLGVALAVVGAVMIVIDARVTPLPKGLPWVVMGAALVLMLAAIAMRGRYHNRRMRGH
jgi:hypothetical protein